MSTPIGNLQDITLRALETLRAVDAIAAEDTRRTRILLEQYGIRKPMVSYHEHNKGWRGTELLARLRSGQSIAVVSDAGTPGISDPAYELVCSCIAAGVPVVPIPGPSALVAALTISGLPTDRFVFEGFLPVKKGRQKRLEALREETRTIILFEAPHRIERTLTDLLAHLGNRQAALVRELTKVHEEVWRGSLAELLERSRREPPRGELVLVVEGKTRRFLREQVQSADNGKKL
ncbi:MAG: 16S rRNA (cytidine(1402)-2'-O)-methyltransferase [candidate division KSB1 bacterium]|nr:16S rRNA (cytidine(1402)-2'-O)-methyltransferase [candidate division KSB1 bacterium]